MTTQLPHQRPRRWMATRKAGARLARLATVLAAVIASLLASLTAATPAPATTVRVISTGGMAGWQITLIALGAALAAAAAVLLDRKLASRRGATATTA